MQEMKQNVLSKICHCQGQGWFTVSNSNLIENKAFIGSNTKCMLNIKNILHRKGEEVKVKHSFCSFLSLDISFFLFSFSQKPQHPALINQINSQSCLFPEFISPPRDNESGNLIFFMYFQNNVDSVTTKPRKQTACLMNLYILSIPVHIIPTVTYIQSIQGYRFSSHEISRYLVQIIFYGSLQPTVGNVNIHLLFINNSTLLLIRFRKCKFAALMVVGCELGTRNINIQMSARSAPA